MAGIFDTNTALKTPTAVGFNQAIATPIATATATANKTNVAVRVITDDEIYNLGASTASQSMAMSNKILASVTATDTEQFGEKLNALVGLSKQLDPSKMGKPGLLKRIFNVGASLTDRIKTQYDTVEQRMNVLSTELDKMADKRRQRVADLEQMYIENQNNYNNLQQDVAEGHKLLEILQQESLQYTNTSDPFIAENLAKVNTRISALKKRIDDFERGMQLCVFAAPDIRMQQEHNRSLASSVRDIKVTTIPAWQGVFSRYILALETKKGAALINSVYDATDEAFRMQADQLLENTVAVVTAQQRSVVSVDTLQHMQKQLIAAVDQAREIEQKATKDRELAKPQLQQLTQDLINRYQGKV